MEAATNSHDREAAIENVDDPVPFLPLPLAMSVGSVDTFEDWTTPRSSSSQQTLPPTLSPRSSMQRRESWPLPPPEQEPLLDSPRLECDPGQPSSVDSLPPPSPSHGAWRTEPPSIEEPLLLLDEDDDESNADAAATISRLRAELAEARTSIKADRASLDSLTSNAETKERERATLLAECDRYKHESNALKQQLENHHGIMAADWAQTLGFQERLRQEEAACVRLASEVHELKEEIVVHSEELSRLRQDASSWRLLSCTDSLQSARAEDLSGVLELALPGITRIHTEMHNRNRVVERQLAQELEGRLCVVCRDEEKSILFKPCLHVCVCEKCRSRLRPYRCPICQEPVREHVGRVHF